MREGIGRSVRGEDDGGRGGAEGRERVRVVRHGRGEREEFVVRLGQVLFQLRDVRLELLRRLQRGAPCFFFSLVAAIVARGGAGPLAADTLAEERLRMAFPVQEVRELLVSVIEPLYGLDRADGEGRLAVEGVVRFVHRVLREGAVVQPRLWQRGRGGVGGRFCGAVSRVDAPVENADGRWATVQGEAQDGGPFERSHSI